MDRNEFYRKYEIINLFNTEISLKVIKKYIIFLQQFWLFLFLFTSCLILTSLSLYYFRTINERYVFGIIMVVPIIILAIIGISLELRLKYFSTLGKVLNEKLMVNIFSFLFFIIIMVFILFLKYIDFKAIDLGMVIALTTLIGVLFFIIFLYFALVGNKFFIEYMNNYRNDIIDYQNRFNT